MKIFFAPFAKALLRKSISDRPLFQRGRKVGILRKLLFILTLLITPCFSAQDEYSFVAPEQQQRFESLTSELRCLVCQNQTLAESNASLAVDLRQQVYQKILQGHSDKEIVEYLVARYGSFILYRPPLDWRTAGLWFGPFLFLMAGMGYLIYYIKKTQRD